VLGRNVVRSRLFFATLLVKAVFAVAWLLSPQSVHLAAAQALEYDVNRPGQDYRNFDLLAADPALCQRACTGDSQCRAFTYVKPGVQGRSARCWLKTGVPDPIANNCCVSGVAGAAQRPERSASTHVRRAFR
jgi:hypothetical protein